jgi:uncharacterized protein with gpF-like domain
MCTIIFDICYLGQYFSHSNHEKEQEEEKKGEQEEDQEEDKEEEQELLESNISAEELAKAVKELPNSKAFLIKMLFCCCTGSCRCKYDT